MSTSYEACPSCDAAITAGSQFCAACGVKVDDARQQAVPKSEAEQESWLKTKLKDWGILKDESAEEGGSNDQSGGTEETSVKETEGDGLYT